METLYIIEVGGLNKTASENSNVTLTVTYDKNTGEVKGIVPSGYSKFFDCKTGDTGVVKIKNLVTPNYKIKKIDENENALDGVEFKVTYDLWDELGIEEEHKSSTFTTNANGEVNILNEEIKQAIMNKFISAGGENPIGFWIDIEETKTKDGYINILGNKSIRLMYDGLKLYNASSYDYSDIVDGSYKINQGENCIYIKNKSGIEKLTILKVDSANPDKKLEGAVFEITLTNISTVDGQKYSKDITKTVPENGQIVLEKLEITDLSKDVTIQIKETEAPEWYKLIDGTITITLKRNGDEYTTHTVATSGNVLDSEVKAGDIDVNNHEVKLTIGNLEVINLSGQVWLDGQIGNKDVSESYNGKIDSSEKKVQDVKVHLYSVKDGKVISTKTTDLNGKYEFSDVIKTAEGYKVYFEYNGLLYNDVGITGDSKAAENANERTTFNNRFKIITQGKSNDGTALTYSYSDNKSVLNASVDGSTPTNSSIKAYTNVYKTTTSNINCGLISKYYDLKLDNLIENVRYTINGKEATETLTGDINEAERLTKYSDSMEVSDYSYRFDDYGTNKLEVYERESEDEDFERSQILTEGTELEVYVTYNLKISNQNNHTTKEAVVEYTYDASKYELLSIDGKDATGNGKITLTVSDLTKDVKEKNILLTFKLVKDSERNLPKEILNESGLTVETKAEIVSYTTNDGALIDADSAPGNGEEYKEDDFSTAQINFTAKESKREISGNVAEANTNDGSLEDGKNIDNVIVQLVEIVSDDNDTPENKSDDKLREYIWQETASGSSQVKARGKDKKVYTYDNGLENATGEYKFLAYSLNAKDSEKNETKLETGFIPGNYIVRFIYGDGTVLYLNSAGDMKLLEDMTYNGQDYKSTIDKSYQDEWYSPDKYNGKSTARDNEARRLQVMAFSTEIDGELGTALKALNISSFAELNSEEQELLKDYYKKVESENKALLQLAYRAAIHGNPYATEHSLPEELRDEELFKTIKHYISRKTWMCAETSKIDVGINSTTFDKVNFGLMLRPTTELTVEKHITGLKITPTGTGVQPIVDATKGIDEENAKGVTNGLAIIESTRADRGFWKVETDIEELMQGAKLEVEYTYVIKNNSKDDYLSKDLVTAYESNPKGYDDTLKTLAGNVKNDIKTQGAHRVIGTVLGTYYYTGKYNESTDAKVPSIVESLEEALNNQLAFTSSSDFTAETLNETDNYDYYNETGVKEKITIKTLVKTNYSDSEALDIGGINSSKKIRLETTLSSSNNGEIGTTIPSYITEITSYSNAAGRENIAVPENLTYVHSEDNELTLDSYVAKDTAENITAIKTTAESGYVQINEADEFWGETIIISKPTGQDKNTPLLITIIAISGVAVIGVGIILIKKFVIKK